MKYDPIITVCNKCLQAACWQGEFMCETAVSEGIVDRRVSSLIRDGETREHPDYWNKHLDMGHERLLTREDLVALGITNEEMLELS